MRWRFTSRDGEAEGEAEGDAEGLRLRFRGSGEEEGVDGNGEEEGEGSVCLWLLRRRRVCVSAESVAGVGSCCDSGIVCASAAKVDGTSKVSAGARAGFESCV